MQIKNIKKYKSKWWKHSQQCLAIIFLERLSKITQGERPLEKFLNISRRNNKKLLTLLHLQVILHSIVDGNNNQTN